MNWNKNIKIISLGLLIVIIFISSFGFILAEGLADWPEIELEQDMREESTVNSYACGSEGATNIDVKTGSVYYYKEVNRENVLTGIEEDGICEGKQKRVSSTKIDYKPGTNIQRGLIKEGKKCIGGGGYLEDYDGLNSANQETDLVPEGAEAMWNDPRDRPVACGPTATPNGFTLAEIEEEDAPEEPPIGHVYSVENGEKTQLDAVPRPYWAEPAGVAAIPTIDNTEFVPFKSEEFCNGPDGTVVIQDSKWKKVMKFPGKFLTGVAKAPLKILKGTVNTFIPACEGSGRYDKVLIQINPGDTSESILTRIKDRIIESLKPGCEIGRDASQVNEAFITINLDNILDNQKTAIVEYCGEKTGDLTGCQAAENLVFSINECRDVCEDYGQGGFDVGGGAITVGLDCVGADFLNLIGFKADAAATAVFVGYGAASSGGSSGGGTGGGGTGGGGTGGGGTGGDKIISSFDWSNSGTPWSP